MLIPIKYLLRLGEIKNNLFLILKDFFEFIIAHLMSFGKELISLFFKKQAKYCRHLWLGLFYLWISKNLEKLFPHFYPDRSL